MRQVKAASQIKEIQLATEPRLTNGVARTEEVEHDVVVTTVPKAGGQVQRATNGAGSQAKWLRKTGSDAKLVLNRSKGPASGAKI